MPPGAPGTTAVRDRGGEGVSGVAKWRPHVTAAILGARGGRRRVTWSVSRGLAVTHPSPAPSSFGANSGTFGAQNHPKPGAFPPRGRAYHFFTRFRRIFPQFKPRFCLGRPARIFRVKTRSFGHRRVRAPPGLPGPLHPPRPAWGDSAAFRDFWGRAQTLVLGPNSRFAWGGGDANS